MSEIKSYVSLAGDNDVTPREDQSVLVASPTECRLVFGHENTPSKASSRNSSYSEENRLSEGARVGSEEKRKVSVEEKRKASAEEKRKANAYVVTHIPLWLGFAAGAICYLLKNGSGRGEGVSDRRPGPAVCGLLGGAAAAVDGAVLRRAGEVIHILVWIECGPSLTHRAVTEADYCV